MKKTVAGCIICVAAVALAALVVRNDGAAALKWTFAVAAYTIIVTAVAGYGAEVGTAAGTRLEPLLGLAAVELFLVALFGEGMLAPLAFAGAVTLVGAMWIGEGIASIRMRRRFAA